jgi:hypothetical protein
MEIKRKRVRITHRSGRFVILVYASTDANPERIENASETDKAKGKATCL